LLRHSIRTRPITSWFPPRTGDEPPPDISRLTTAVRVALTLLFVVTATSYRAGWLVGTVLTATVMIVWLFVRAVAFRRSVSAPRSRRAPRQRRTSRPRRATVQPMMSKKRLKRAIVRGPRRGTRPNDEQVPCQPRSHRAEIRMALECTSRIVRAAPLSAESAQALSFALADRISHLPLPTTGWTQDDQDRHVMVEAISAINDATGNRFMTENKREDLSDTLETLAAWFDEQ
jgi:hypothetical protein